MRLPDFIPVIALVLFNVFLPAATPSGKTQQFTSLDQVPDGLAKSDWQSIRAAYEAGRHAFQPIEGGWKARNPGQQWTTKFDRRGFVAEPRDGGWQWGLELKSYGFAGAARVIRGVPVVKAEGQRLTYVWDAAVEEWFVNDARGLEHGFSMKERPAQNPGSGIRDPKSELFFTLAVRGSLHPHITADAQGVEFRDATGATVLTYSGLKVWDADGRALPTRFEPLDARHSTLVTFSVDERGARYPLTIDPLAQQAYLKPAAVGTTQAGDRFGESVAISGDTVIVGAFREDSSTTGVNSTPNESATDSGAACVFVRSGTTWTQQAWLKPAAVGFSQAGDNFGQSVAISGNTVVVGAFREDSNTTGVNGPPSDDGGANYDGGAAYVFVRNGTTWTQQAYLKPAAVGSTQAGDNFGISVAVSGDTVVVGANLEDSSTTGVNSTPNEGAPNSGAAYIFTRSGTAWTQQSYLKPAAVGLTQAGDDFGISVAVSGDTVVVGANDEDSSTTGVNSTPDDPGVGNVDSGAAFVFTRSGTTWTQQAYLKPAAVGTTQMSDRFGFSVAVSGDTVVIGAIGEDSSTTGVNSTPNESASASGAAYVFTRSGATWTQQAYFKPAAVGTTQAGDVFGISVAVSGDTVVVGANVEDSSTTGVNSTPNESADDSGAAYLFTRTGTTWTQRAYLKPAAVGTTQADDRFGFSVAVSGDTVVIGANEEDSSTMGVNSTPNDDGTAIGSGAAYLFITTPEIVIEQPAGTDLPAAGSVSFGGRPVGNASAAKIFTVRNLGTSDLTITEPSLTGGNAGDFAVNTTGTLLTIAVGQQTTFGVAFTPGAAGARSTTLRTQNNDPEENPFDITLTGTGLVITQDTDGDGLNDVAESNYAAFGFDPFVAQPALVSTLYGDANDAGLFTPTQVQALNLGARFLERNQATGQFTLEIGMEKSADLMNFVPFSFLAPQTTVRPDGKIEFLFTVPDNAAFFRLEPR